MLKKILCMLCVLCMLCSLAACTPYEENPDATNTSAPEESTQPTEPEKDPDDLIKEGTLLYPATNELFRYDVYTTYVSITEYIGSDTTVVIPNEIETLPVLSIDYSAFAKRTHVTEVVISEGIVYIGSDAFNGCTQLKTVKLPSSLRGISNNAFYNCSSLTELTIPAGIYDIPQSMCYGCTSLITVVWEDMPAEEQTDVQKTIGNSAFYGCTALRLLWIPDEVVSIKTGSLGTSPNLVIHGYTASAAAHYASDHFIDFVVLDEENLATAIKDAQNDAAKEDAATEPETTVPEESTNPSESTAPSE